MNDPVKIGVLTVSDRASRGQYEDRSGPAVLDCLKLYLVTRWERVCAVVPDEADLIEKELRRMADEEGCCLIITTGGTGPTKRDLTPEATLRVCEKVLPGFGECMRKNSFDEVPTTILSRQTAGVRGGALIINLPGNPKAMQECLETVFPAVPACIKLIGGPVLECDPNVIAAYHPKHE